MWKLQVNCKLNRMWLELRTASIIPDAGKNNKISYLVLVLQHYNLLSRDNILIGKVIQVFVNRQVHLDKDPTFSSLK